MNGEKSREALFEFLDYLSSKGLMAKNTVSARKAACGKVLGILSDEDAADITELDLKNLMLRFHHLHGKNYTAPSLNTYSSRVKAAIEDFKTYTNNPLGYQPSIKTRKVKPNNVPQSSLLPRKLPTEIHTPNQQPFPQVSSVLDTILPIQIRADTIVHIQGLPFDLSEAEAEKIANVIKAMAT